METLDNFLKKYNLVQIERRDIYPSLRAHLDWSPAYKEIRTEKIRYYGNGEMTLIVDEDKRIFSQELDHLSMWGEYILYGFENNLIGIKFLHRNQRKGNE